MTCSPDYPTLGITPAMIAPEVGLGSAYGIGAQDVNGDYLDGGKSSSALLRRAGSLQSFFDKSWVPGDFELVD